MTWTVKTKQTRPNTDVDWFSGVSEDSAAIDSDRRSSGKLVSVDTT